MNSRRLFRSRTDRALTGIAGGMAEYLEVDPTIVRILWVLAAIFSGGLAILLYIVLAFVIPVNPYHRAPMAGGAYGAAPTGGWGAAAQPPSQAGTTYATAGGYAAPAYTPAYAPGTPAAGGDPAWSAGWNAEYEQSRAARAQRPGRAGVIIGTVLIVFGAIALADIVIPGWISGALLVPGLFVALGLGLVVASLRGRGDEVAYAAAPASAPASAAAAAAAEPVTPPAEGGSASDIGSSEGFDEDSTTTLPPLPGPDGA